MLVKKNKKIQNIESKKKGKIAGCIVNLNYKFIKKAGFCFPTVVWFQQSLCKFIFILLIKLTKSLQRHQTIIFMLLGDGERVIL